VSEHEKERWRELCEQASKEKDPEKLQQLVEEIVRLTQPRRTLPLDINSGIRRDE
jgi:hypothetical protein